jgi:hypothetical protein
MGAMNEIKAAASGPALPPTAAKMMLVAKAH